MCQRCGAEIEDINHLLFECPPAFLCWILSSIPSSPGVFPCSSLFANFEYLLAQVTTENQNALDFSIFPWLLWYVWKARNDKCFNAKDISPLDTLQLARQEGETWKKAQLGMEHQYTCQVDGSWAVNDDWMGAGFVLLEADEVLLQGQRCGRRAKSPLHAEVEGIIWAMKEVRNRGLDDIDFGSDCQQLVKLTGGDEEWPALAAELDEVRLLLSNFQNVSFSFVPRSQTFRADSLAKGGRSRAQIFSVVNTMVPFWPAPVARLNEPV
ncbi:hypothetical protein Bca52824_079763 [Brassica carinata]|uniref:RNase H type-1 domain-containing protein n=1 Tax=Brassica carinata TaxID=52824 RepID=A0A8X7Q3N6_BRACI|nr:hypothetical protein Bca52824_079763 [Brassica carinata]